MVVPAYYGGGRDQEYLIDAINITLNDTIHKNHVMPSLIAGQWPIDLEEQEPSGSEEPIYLFCD
jgi:hypothetical protein